MKKDIFNCKTKIINLSITFFEGITKRLFFLFFKTKNDKRTLCYCKTKMINLRIKFLSGFGKHKRFETFETSQRSRTRGSRC